MKSVKLISSAIAMLICFITTAQEKMITGIVSDDIYGTLPGAGVYNTRSKRGSKSKNKNQDYTAKQKQAASESLIISKDTIPDAKSSAKEPLYILDNKIVNSKQFSKINPNDIEEIKVLKGNEAKLIYGHKGSNGAVIITLKK